MEAPVDGPRALVLEEKRIVRLSKPFAETFVVEKEIHDGGERCRIKRVRNLDDGKVYVAKIQLKLQIRGRREDLFRPLTERMLALTDSPYVVKTYACYEDDCYFYTILENLEGGDLYDFFRMLHPAKTSSIHRSQAPPLRAEELEPVVRKLMFSMLRSLQHLHVQDLLHLDVKLENFVFRRKSKTVQVPNFMSLGFSAFFGDCAGASNKLQVPGELKIIDFDFLQESRAAEKASTHTRYVLGTDGYIAPEVYMGSPCPESDVFSAGVVMYALMTGRMAFSSSIFDDEDSENYIGSPKMAEISGKLKNYQVWFGHNWDKFPDAKDLCESMLAVDVKQRLDTYKALRHPWFSSSNGYPTPSPGPVAYPSSLSPPPIAAKAA